MTMNGLNEVDPWRGAARSTSTSEAVGSISVLYRLALCQAVDKKCDVQNEKNNYCLRT